MKMKVLKTVIPFVLIVLVLVSCGENPKAGETNDEMASSTESEKGIPVEVMKVTKKAIEQSIPLTGILEPVNSVDLIAEVSGEVKKIQKELGQFISTTDTLAFIDDRIPKSNYEQALAQVLSAENNLRIAKLNLESDKDLLASGDISKLAYENSVFSSKSAEANLLAAKATLSAQQKAYEDTRITSPISGWIARKNIELGTMVTMGMTLYRVVDVNTLKLKVGVPQSVIGSVKQGSSAEIDVSGMNNGTYSGYVKYVSPQADENTGSFQVEIYVKNNNKMLAGMTASVNLNVVDSEEKLVVPDYSVVTKNETNYVYVVHNNRAKLTEVKLGRSYEKQVEILDGIAEGDQIVVVGMKNLGLDTKVRIETVN